MVKKLFSFMLFFGISLHAATLVSVTLKDLGQPELLDRNQLPAGLYHLEFGNQILPVLCVDYTDRDRAGETWTAIVTPLSDLSSGHPPHAQLAYRETAWLYTQDLQPGANRIGIQHAAWSLLDPGFPVDPAAFVWESAADFASSKVDLSQFFLVSSAPGMPRAQKFIFESPNQSFAPAPEPNTLFPVSLGFISLSAGLGWFREKRGRRNRHGDAVASLTDGGGAKWYKHLDLRASSSS